MVSLSLFRSYKDEFTLDHLKGEDLFKHFPQGYSLDHIRSVLVVTPSCGSCYEALDELKRFITSKPQDLILLLVNDSQQSVDWFLDRYRNDFQIQEIEEAVIKSKLKIQILPVFLRVDEEGKIKKATSHYREAIKFLKGGE